MTRRWLLIGTVLMLGWASGAMARPPAQEADLCGGKVTRVRGEALKTLLVGSELGFENDAGVCPGGVGIISRWGFEALRDGSYVYRGDPGERRGLYEITDDRLCFGSVVVQRICWAFFRDAEGRYYFTGGVGPVPAMVRIGR